MTRTDSRTENQIRRTSIELGAQTFAEGSVIIETGMTRVLCAVTIEDGVPGFLKNKGHGWVTAEYSMLPRSTLTRTRREPVPRGRTQEIQRLIGRSLRASVDLSALGERTFTIDCDVLQADGGTRTTSITGAYVALYQAIASLTRDGKLSAMPQMCQVAATSVGIVGGFPLLDLNYEEDFKASVDCNIVMSDAGEFIEVQGTAEEGSFSKSEFDRLLELAEKGIRTLFEIQKKAIASL